eukprot:ANDGO_00148.mRNA.1 Aminopeptidase 1
MIRDDSMDDDVGDLRIVQETPVWKKVLKSRKFWIGSGIASIVLLLVIIVAATSGKEESSSNNSGGDGGNSNPDIAKACVVSTVSKYRLPQSVFPIEYSVEMQRISFAPNFNFSGVETVAVSVVQDTSCVQMHAENIAITSVTTSLGKVLSYSIDPETDILTIQLDVVAKSGQHGTIDFKYNGILANDAHGFYRAGYTNASYPQQIWLGVTQFESTSARRAFVCFDEALFKANFSFVLIAPSGAAAFSNMPVKTRAPWSQDVSFDRVEFEPTVKMSSYLLAWIIAPEGMDRIEKDVGGINYGAITIPGIVDQAQFALDTASQAIPWFNKNLGINYPLPKVDIAAIVEFSAGAMENWGLVTFRDRAILVNSDTTSSDLDYVFRVVCHELAHQWFGNLITPVWWSELWLAEGFATFFEYFTSDKLKPEWKIMPYSFLTGEIAGLLEEDSLNSTTAMINPQVFDQGEIDSMFDYRSYDKGGNVLRMIFNDLGEDDFFRGLQAYLATWQYRNPSTSNLWDSIDKAVSAANKGKIFKYDGWVRQPGYPLLTSQYDAATGKLVVSQAAINAFDKTSVWHVNLRLVLPGATAVDTSKTIDTRAGATFDIGQNLTWYKLNAGQVVIARVNYPLAVWQAFAAAIAGGDTASMADAGDRFSVINDAFYFASVKSLPIADVLNLVKALKDESEYPVWSVALSNLQKWAVLARTDASFGNFRKFVRTIIQKATTAIGMTPVVDESVQIGKLRYILYSTAIAYGDDAIITALASKFSDSAAMGALSGDMRTAVYVAYVTSGGEAAYDAVYTQLGKPGSTPGETARILRALSAAQTPYLLTKSLIASLDESKVRAQDSVTFLAYIASSYLGQQLAWEYVQENWDEYVRRYGAGYTMGRVVSYTTGDFATSSRLAEFDAFFSTHRPSTAATAIDSARERILSNIAWRATNMNALSTWLTANVV